MLWLERPHGLRLMLGREALALQGFPVTSVLRVLLDIAGETLVLDRSGNMLSLTVVLAMVVALFTCISWAGSTAPDAPPATEEEEEVMAAFNLFEGMFMEA